MLTGIKADVAALLPHNKLCDLRIKAKNNSIPLPRLLENMVDAYLNSGSYDLPSLQDFTGQILSAVKEYYKQSETNASALANEVKKLWEYRADSDSQIYHLKREIDKIETRLDKLSSKLSSKKTSDTASNHRGSGRLSSMAIDPSISPDKLIGQVYGPGAWGNYLGLSKGDVSNRLGKAKSMGQTVIKVRGLILEAIGPGQVRLNSLMAKEPDQGQLEIESIS